MKKLAVTGSDGVVAIKGMVLDTDSFVSAEGTSSIGTACETKFSAGKSAGLLGFHITLG